MIKYVAYKGDDELTWLNNEEVLKRVNVGDMIEGWGHEYEVINKKFICQNSECAVCIIECK